MIIGLIIGIFAIVFILGVVFAMRASRLENKAKKEANAIIKSGTLPEPKKVDRILFLLNTCKDDEEAKHLWHRLTALKDQAG